MVKISANILNIDIANSIIAGNRLHTDIAMAINAQIKSTLVLSGDSTMEEVIACKDIEKPTFCLNSINQIIPKSN